MRILVLTEDSAESAPGVIRELSRKLLQRVHAHPSQLITWPRADTEKARTCHAMRWRSTSRFDEPAVRDLARWVAQELFSSFVLFHIDGDVPWSQRPGLNLAALDGFKGRVKQNLLAAKNSKTEREREDLLEKFIPIVPYYSIEAWTYQHTEVAEIILREEFEGRDIALVRGWLSNRQALDDEEKPAERCCLGKGHNLRLVGPRYPTDEVLAAETSLYKAYRGLADCSALVAELKKLQT